LTYRSHARTQGDEGALDAERSTPARSARIGIGVASLWHSAERPNYCAKLDELDAAAGADLLLAAPGIIAGGQGGSTRWLTTARRHALWFDSPPREHRRPRGPPARAHI
jgi:hypothetical protein